MGNYLDISQEERGKNIFRVLTIERLIEMFEKKINTLVKPERWDDPFENFILNIPVKNSKGEDRKSMLRNRSYGQCWTLTRESDAMWRIYAPDKNGVKINTKIRKLYKSLHDAQSSYANISCFIGKVEYYPKDKINQIIDDRIEGTKQFDGSIGQAKSLLFKRAAFQHEKEIRLIYLDPNNQVDSEHYHYHCDPTSLIDGITFDPRMSPRLYKIFKKYLIEIGYKGKIIQSGLYRAPNFD